MLTFEEKTLIPVLNRNYQHLVQGTFGQRWGNAAVLDEVNSGFGIADLVIFDRSPMNSLQCERNIFFNKEDQIKTLLAVNKETVFSVTDLSQKLSFSPARLRTQIRTFEAAGFVKALEPGLYEVINQYSSPLENSIAIEAKVRDWRRGLYQAYRYRWFSNASYLAMHHSFIEAPKRNLAEFIHLNVGLIEVCDEEIKIIYSPNLEQPLSIITNALASEQILSRHSYWQNTCSQG